MTSFNRQWREDIILPDGSKASCKQDVDRFLKETGLAIAGDYSDDFRQKVRLNQKRTERKLLWAEFIHNYKRSIWYAKK